MSVIIEIDFKNDVLFKSSHSKYWFLLCPDCESPGWELIFKLPYPFYLEFSPFFVSLRAAESLPGFKSWLKDLSFLPLSLAYNGFSVKCVGILCVKDTW